MAVRGWLFFAFTLLLSGVLIGIMIYYFRSKRKHRVEEPKYRMLDDDDEHTRNGGQNPKQG
jgi:cbb3-type cytochrome oxidase subunit 3